MKSKININLLGKSFILTSDQDEEYFNILLDKYSEIVKKVQQDIQNADPIKIAIIAGLIALDSNSNTSKQEKDLLETSQDSEKLTSQLTLLIDKLNTAINDK